MHPDNIQLRIQQLRTELDAHNYNYYVLDKPIISDYEFDVKMKELMDLEAANPQFADPQSPSQRVGGKPLSKFVNKRHQFPMLSLGNTYSEAELVDFAQRVERGLGGNAEYIAELKFDGISISLLYENGVLVQALTRGDGTTGDDVTENVKTIKSIPLRLQGNDYPERFEIRGEILIHKNHFEKLNETRVANGDEPYANPRNFASGTMKLLNPADVAKRKLDAYMYYLKGDNLPFATHYESMMAAKSWGFKVSELLTQPTDLPGIMKYIHEIEVKRAALPFEIDGVVVKVNSIYQQEELGFTAKIPRWAISFKYKALAAETILQTITYQVGRTGAVTPVANLAPVLLAGTVVKRASLYNETEIERLDLHQNDAVLIEKGGEIIPKVTGVVVEKRLPNALKFSFINNCPECNTALVKISGEAIYYCPNETGCAPQIKGKLEHFVGRKAMNIESIGKETIEVLFNKGLVQNIGDFYTLTYHQLSGIDRMGDKSIQNMLQGIELSKQVPFEKVLFAIGIRLVGETVAKTLVKHFPNIHLLAAASFEELVAIHEIGDKIALNVQAWFSNPENLELINKLENSGLQFTSTAVVAENTSDKLAGKTFLISGVFQKFDREEIKQLVESNGGKNLSSISSKLNFLIAGENMGPAKLAKATELGIRIISEDEFESMIQ